MSFEGDLEPDTGMCGDMKILPLNPLVPPPFISSEYLSPADLYHENYGRTQDSVEYEDNSMAKPFLVPPISSFTNHFSYQSNEGLMQEGDYSDKEDYPSQEVLKEAQVGKITYDFEPTNFPEICTNVTTAPGQQHYTEEYPNQMTYNTDRHFDNYSTLQPYDYSTDRKSSVSSTDGSSVTVSSEDDYEAYQHHHNVYANSNLRFGCLKQPFYDPEQPYYDHNQQMQSLYRQRQFNEDLPTREPDSTTFNPEYRFSKSRSGNAWYSDTKGFKFRKGRRTRGPKLWEFLWELLHDPACNPEFILWQDEDKKIFRIVKSKNVAHLWGLKKQKKGMTYEFMSRAMRYYYKKHIMYRVKDKRLVYQFGPAALQSTMYTSRC